MSVLCKAKDNALLVELRGEDVCAGGRVLVRGLDLRLRLGDTLVVTGPSGCGKSTLLNQIGQRLGCQRNGSRVSVARVAQERPALPGLTVLENILCGSLPRCGVMALAGIFPAREQERACDLARSIGLGEALHRPVARCSGGECQRAAVARALLRDADVILADEPVSQLDEAAARRTLELLVDTAKSRPTALVCVLHNSAWAREFFDRELRLGLPEAGWKVMEHAQIAI